MKRNILFCLFAVVFFGLNACKKESATDTGIRINFINKTGGTIEGAVADNVGIGQLANNAQTGFIRFTQFRKDTGFPDCDFTGMLNADSLKSTSVFYWCGTEKSLLEPGEYHIEIGLQTMGAKKYFHLLFR